MGRGYTEEREGWDKLAPLGWGGRGLAPAAGGAVERAREAGRWPIVLKEPNIYGSCRKIDKGGLLGNVMGFIQDKDKPVTLEDGWPNFPSHQG